MTNFMMTRGKFRDQWFLWAAGEIDITRGAFWERRKNPWSAALRIALQVAFLAAAWRHSWMGAILSGLAFIASYFVIPAPKNNSRAWLARVIEGQRVWIREGSRLAREDDLFAGLALSPQFYVCWGCYFFGVLVYACWSQWPIASAALGLVWIAFNALFAWWALRIARRVEEARVRGQANLETRTSGNGLHGPGDAL